ncbi:MAG: hypothetical protein ACRECJ_01020, partial [Limisphaerales bacterium]
FWLANGLFCFCTEEISKSPVCEVAGCADESAPPAPGTGNDDCGLCCGHLVFTPGSFVTINNHFTEQEFSLSSMDFPDQFSFRSIYHPPKA